MVLVLWPRPSIVSVDRVYHKKGKREMDERTIRDQSGRHHAVSVVRRGGGGGGEHCVHCIGQLRLCLLGLRYI